jgi:hypothetical protein
MPATVPGCELQNFTPNVTAAVSLSTSVDGTALPNSVTV